MTTELALAQVLESIAELKAEFKTEFKELERKVDISNEKFDNYQKATKSLVNLAFGLIASATVITVVSSVFRR